MAQQGFQYEANATDYLFKNFKLSDGKVAGASHDRPDIMLTYAGKAEGCELKISDSASGGSLVIKYYDKKKPHFQFNVDPSEVEKMFLKELAESSGILDKVNREWGKPYLVEDRDQAWEEQMLKVPLKARYKHDLEVCKDFKMLIASDAMANYYANKNTHYINIGTSGFYIFGNKDPFGLNKKMSSMGMPLIPSFSQNVVISGRARIQSKGTSAAESREKSSGKIGGQGYQMTFEIQFKIGSKSPYNIAPCTKSNVSIIPGAVNVSCFVP